ncbi:MAG: ribosomal subunit protein large subunit ribosomal protein [Candidatus Parcubacteria bacterium]|jgi:large subunit ribosomal protein L23
MALFSRTKKEKKETVTDAVATVKTVSKALATDIDLSSVLVNPRITEKAVRQNDNNVYTFVVARNATKYTVADAVKALFKVTPVKVNIVNKSPRQFMSGGKGRTVSEKGMKKAYVYLKKGDRIDIV